MILSKPRSAARNLVLAAAVLAAALAPSLASADSWRFAGTNPRLATGFFLPFASLVLADGRLLASGFENGIETPGTRLFDPSAETWTSVALPNVVGAMALLGDGKVLLAGGRDGGNSPTVAAAIWDPATSTSTTVQPMGTARTNPTATTLADGRVLVVGGDGSAGAEIYDPVADTWTPTAAVPERFQHSATLLVDGRVLVAGGANEDENTEDSAFLYDPVADTWTPTSAMSEPRSNHRAFRLADGSVLVAGGQTGANAVERYDPVAGTWSTASPAPTVTSGPAPALLDDGRVLLISGSEPLPTPPFFSFTRLVQAYDPANDTWSTVAPVPNSRFYPSVAQTLPDGRVAFLGFGEVSGIDLYDPDLDSWKSPVAMGRSSALHTASLLGDGRVLLAGGYGGYPNLAASSDARLYDPATNSWSVADAMDSARAWHDATTLDDGRVLVTGGDGGPDTRACELYDPTTGTWSPAASMTGGRHQHTATLLADGHVLVAGGRNSTAIDTAEIYDPVADAWTPAAAMNTPRYGHRATRLDDGRVLVTGGAGVALADTAEIYDPVADSWTTVAPMGVERAGHNATLLLDGRVLVTGDESEPTTMAEIYDPVADSWTTAAPLAAGRAGHTAVRVADGRVLVTGGYDDFMLVLESELYDPATDTWSSAASMIHGSIYLTLTLLGDGSVLSSGGAIFEFPSGFAERWSPLDGACPAEPDPACGQAGKSSLALQRPADASKAKLTWKWSKGIDALAPADFGDPAAGSTGYSLCVYDERGTSTELALELAVEAGGTCGTKDCWKAMPGKGFSYKSKTGSDAGVTKVSLKGGAAGKPALQFAGKGADLALPSPVSGSLYFEVDDAVTVQLHRDDDGRCWGGRYEAAAVKKNDATRFSAVAP